VDFNAPPTWWGPHQVNNQVNNQVKIVFEIETKNAIAFAYAIEFRLIALDLSSDTSMVRSDASDMKSS